MPTLVARYGLDGKRVLLTLGRVVAAERYKGFDEVLEVLPDLAARHRLRHRRRRQRSSRACSSKAARLGVADRVVFTGFFPSDEKADLYSLADVYVMPSRGEGFGFVFLEAMASAFRSSAADSTAAAKRCAAASSACSSIPTNPAEIRTGHPRAARQSVASA